MILYAVSVAQDQPVPETMIRATKSANLEELSWQNAQADLELHCRDKCRRKSLIIHTFVTCQPNNHADVIMHVNHLMYKRELYVGCQVSTINIVKVKKIATNEG